MNIKGKRVEVEKTRKKLKEDALEYGRAVDGEAKRITALLAPIETYLESQEKIIDDEKARIKADAAAVEAARVQARTDKLYDMGLISRNGNICLSFTAEGYVPEAIVKTCPDEQFEEICAKFQISVDAENARIEKEKADKLAEEERMAKARVEQEAEAKRLEVIAKEQADAAAKIKADQLEIEVAKQRIVDEEKAKLKAIADAQALANAKQEAAEKAVIETEARIKREAEEISDKERLAKIETDRQEALKPDKEKLITYLMSIAKHMQSNCPAIKDKAIYKILVDAEAIIENTIDTFLDKVKEI